MDDNKAQEEIYSQIVRAGKRTYFFDVRATRADDYYLTITESKKFFIRCRDPFLIIDGGVRWSYPWGNNNLFYTKRILQNLKMLSQKLLDL